MSFVIEKVTVSNFRTHEFLEFEPDESGVTVIKGANGTGKSSLVDSIAWCLFGIKPPGVGKNSDLRRKDMSLDKDKCYVEVILKTVSGVHYKVQRRISGKKGSTECDVWTILTDKDDSGNEIKTLDHVAGASVSHAAEFLRANLGVTEKGFLASMFVQQKQVDELLTASPKERSLVIEKMTGITALTEAVSDIKTEVNDAKKTVEVLANNAGEYDVEELEKTINDYKKTLEEINSELESLTDEGKRNKTELLREKEKFNKISEILKRIDSSENEKNNFNKQISFIESTIKDLKYDVEKKEKELEEFSSGIDEKESAESIEKKYEDLSATIRHSQRKVDTLNNEISQTRKLMAGYMKYKDKMADMGIVFTKENFGENTVKDFINSVKSSQEKSTKNIQKLEKDLQDVEKKELNANFEINTHTQTIKALDNEEGECPTCHQKPDNVENLLTSIKSIVESNKKSLEKAKNSKKEITGLLITEKENNEILFNIAKELEVTLENIPILNSLKEELDDNVSKLEKENSDFDVLKVSYDNIRRIESLRHSINQDKNKISSHNEKINEYNSSINELNKQISLLKDDLELYPDFETVEKKINNLNEKLDNLRTKVFENRESRSNLELKIEYAEKDLKRAISSEKEYKRALDKLEKVTASSSVVSSFREKRISEVIPEISFIASDLLQRFTSGKFVGVELDSSYKAKVQLSNGEMRDTGLLSGGELSAVALSLRLAIALISYGDSTGVSTMILDEVLVSQDEDRVESIIATMKEMLQGQLILIGHNGDIISSIADNVVELT